MKPLRVLVTPREIAGVASGLQDTLAERGHRVDVLLRWPHPFGYQTAAPRSPVVRLLSRLVVEVDESRHPRLQRAVSLVVRIALLPLIAARYDAVVYVGPDTLVRGGHDRRLFRRLGRTTVTVFCGSDARPPYMDGWYAGAAATATLPDAREAVTRTRQRVAKAERDSTYVLTHAACSAFLRKPFLDWTVVGFAQRRVPASPAGTVRSPGQGSRPDQPLRVMHAPSVPRMKGSREIRAAVDELRTDIAIDYTELTGRPHAEVQSMLAGADLVVDQLYSDYVLPGLATEAARVGTPALVFGYASRLVAESALRIAGPTRHYANPDQLVTALRRTLTDDGLRTRLAQDLHAFVTTGHWSPEAIGARWERILTGYPEQDWFADPAEIVYAAGCAVSRSDQAAFLREYLRAFGPEALELGHHPELMQALVDSAAR